MGKLFWFYSWVHIKKAVWLYRQTRHECNRLCLWCPFFERCFEEVLGDVLFEEVQSHADGE